MNIPQHKILIVEDDEDFRKNLKKNLDLKYIVLEAEDGEAGVVKFLDHRPKLIILDLLLPKLDGFGLLERLRHYPDPEIASIPLIVLSNLSSNKDILSIQALKIDGYFVKSSTDLADVYKLVDEIIAKH